MDPTVPPPDPARPPPGVDAPRPPPGADPTAASSRSNLTRGNPQPGQWVGPYEVLRVLASGGQGIVVLARHGTSKQEVALKLLLRPESASVRDRFRQEAQVLAQLDHPGLVRVHAFGEAAGLPYLALERVAGRDLSTLLAEDGPPAPEWSASVLARVADALDYCHQRGLVHRDLKPANVVIESGSGRPVLIDFGLVQRDRERLALSSLDERARLTQSDATPGTPPYMPPEQADPASFGPVGPLSDVYGVGAILFALLTGGPPFRGATTLNTLVQVLTDPPPDPRTRREGIPDSLAELCLHCLAKDAADRPASAAALAAALRGELRLRPPRFGRRRRRRLAMIVLPLLALTPLAVLTLSPTPAPAPAPSTPGVVEETPEPSGEPPPSSDDPDLPRWWRPSETPPPLPLPPGVEFGSSADEPFVNLKDKSVLVWVPAGDYALGHARDAINTPHTFRTQGFFIGRYEVSWRQFDAYAAAVGLDAARPVLVRRENESWRPTRVFQAGPNHPASGMTKELALGYCAWAGLHLPTNDHWEAAARGLDGRIYPWDPATPESEIVVLANLNSPSDAFGFLAPVDAIEFARGRSPFGCFHMAGNVAELTYDPDEPDEVRSMGVRGGDADRGALKNIRTYDLREYRQQDGYQGFRVMLDPARLD